MKFNNLTEKKKFLQTALQKGIKAARIESNPVLLYYEENGKCFDARDKEVSKDFVEAHPCSMEITKDDLEL